MEGRDEDWLTASRSTSQARDLYSISTKVFFCSGVYYFLYKENYGHVSVSFIRYIPMFHALIRYTDLFKITRNALECMNVGYYIVATDMFRPLMWHLQGDKKKNSHNYNMSESIHS
jgi:hypothetical protein